MKKKISKPKKVTEVVVNVKKDGTYSTDIRTSPREKVMVANFNPDDKSWTTTFRPGTVQEVVEQLEAAVNMRPSKMISLYDLSNIKDVRTYTIVAEKVDWKTAAGKHRNYTLESGRAMAQGGHAVSKLKLSYLVRSAVGNHSTAYSMIEYLGGFKMTSIMLKARDIRELDHIEDLCNKEGLHCVSFEDEGDELYGIGIKVKTAISIGPCTPHQVEGICDYLPLWNCNCDGV